MPTWQLNVVVSNARRDVAQMPAMDLTRRLKLAAYHFWKIFDGAGTEFLEAYSKVSESDYLQAARVLLSDPETIISSFNPMPSSNADDVARYIGGFLRAADEAIADGDFGSRPHDADLEWRIAGAPEKAYFIPMSPRAFRGQKDPKLDFRRFEQRGLLKNRIIPGTIDGANVRIKFVEKDQGASANMAFGGVLYPSMTFVYDDPDGDFIVTGVRCAQLAEINREAVKAAHKDGCSIAVFPELTVDQASLKSIIDDLETKPWLQDEDDDVSISGPTLVVAGSWHYEDSGVYYNIATVLDGNGECLLRHSKRLPYRESSTGRLERIAVGKELAVLVLEEGLFGFGVCLDYCHEGYDTPYGALDVDFVLVPSCGNQTTMEGHVARAAQLGIRRKMRAFVVQQADPLLANGDMGFILPPLAITHGTRVDKLKVKRSWTVATT